MSALSEKIRKAREIEVKAGGFTFTVRRPSDLEMLDLRSQKLGQAILPYIVGWVGVSELSITGSGSPHPLVFDADVCAEWLADRLDLLGEVINAVFDAYQAHQEKLAEQLKN